MDKRSPVEQSTDPQQKQACEVDSAIEVPFAAWKAMTCREQRGHEKRFEVCAMLVEV